MIKKLLIYLMLFHHISSTGAIIFESNGGHIGDHLTSLYNAYVLAKKYGLSLRLMPFPQHELFECSNQLQIQTEWPQGTVLVHNERDITSHLHSGVNFWVNVLTDRPTPDPITAQEARSLCMLNKNYDLTYLPKINTEKISIAVHVRKGNNNTIDGFVGQLASQQIFEFDRSIVRYSYDSNQDPFGHFRHQNPTTKATGDQFWSLKFPPEQYYIDQLRKIVAAQGVNNLIVYLFTDHRNPYELIARIKQHINPNLHIEFIDNHQKPLNTRIVEDLHLMSQCTILVRAKSGFSVVAELIGDFKTVVFPLEYQWHGNKLIMNHIMVRGERIF